MVCLSLKKEALLFKQRPCGMLLFLLLLAVLISYAAGCLAC